MTTNHKTAWSISILGLVDCWLVKRLILQVMHGFISFTSKRSQCRRYFNKFNRQGQLDNPLTGQTGRAWNLCDHWLFQDGGAADPCVEQAFPTHGKVHWPQSKTLLEDNWPLVCHCYYFFFPTGSIGFWYQLCLTLRQALLDWSWPHCCLEQLILCDRTTGRIANSMLKFFCGVQNQLTAAV